MRERLATAERAVAERDGVLAEVERLQERLVQTHAEHAAEVAAAAAERERLSAGLGETQQALREALERLMAAEVETAELARTATEIEAERDRVAHQLVDTERALRKARKRLTAATRVTEAQNLARAEVERLRAVVEAWQSWAALAPVVEQAPPATVPQDVSEPEPLEQAPDVGDERGDYVLLVPSGKGYALVEATGPFPGTGETLELDDPHTGELSRFAVARVGRSPLPDGGTCVYLIAD
jgi:ABC-type transporter Mla subunit MlaD